MDGTTSATKMNAISFSPQTLPERAVIRVAGDGVLPFLHNILTVDLLQLTQAQAAYGALLTPQGKILHDMFVVAGNDAIYLDCSKLQAETLLQKLIMYRLRAKLEMVIDLSKAVAVSSVQNLPGICCADPRVAAIGHRSVVEIASLDVGQGYNEARIVLGLADSDSDIGVGQMFVHEANLDQLNGVNFQKGCYVGQEVVSRTHHRGTARSRILPVTLDGVGARGAAIESGGQRVGEMLSSVAGNGLALLRLDRLAEATEPLLIAGVRLHVRKPHWATFELIIPGGAQ